MSTILVIDDEPLMHHFFETVFAPSPETVVAAGTAAQGLEIFERDRPDVVLLDVELPDMGGLETFRLLHSIDRKVPVIFMTGGGSTATAIEAMALGAYEYLLKPLNPSQVVLLIAQALKVGQMMRIPPTLAEGDTEVAGQEAMIGHCSAMHQVFKAIGRVAPQEVSVLISGESGTGKELVARAIYQFSRRSKHIFLPINSAAISEKLLESELFGHEKGAYTGADRKRIGKFEQCSGGTLFLDEIGDMSPMTQSKILRVLQEHRFERLGGNETIETDVRVIAATNLDLELLIAAGKFRKDLFYRLNVFPIKLPPLRERQEDLPLLAKYFRNRYARELGKEVAGISAEALALLQGYAWPGNVRELQSVIKYALLQATGPIIIPEFLPEVILQHPAPAALPEPAPVSDLEQFLQHALAKDSHTLYTDWLGSKEKELLLRVLNHTDWNISAAAKTLGISRPTVRSRMAALGFSKEKNPS